MWVVGVMDDPPPPQEGVSQTWWVPSEGNAAASRAPAVT